MKHHFINLFQYDDWANTQIISSLHSVLEPPEKAVSLISHIIAAQDLWLDRIVGKSDFNISVWDSYSVQECAVLSKQSSDNWIKYIRRTGEQHYNDLITYKNIKGIEYSTPLKDIFTHVVYHSTHHRGQINSVLRENSIEPPEISYITYTRLTNEDIS
ncbi:MAG: DinB family protein [bacterium]